MTPGPAPLEIAVDCESQMFLKGPVSACCFPKRCLRLCRQRAHLLRASITSARSRAPKNRGLQGPLSPGELGWAGGGEIPSSPQTPWPNAGKVSASNFEFQNLQLSALAMRIGQIPFIGLLHCLRGKNGHTIWSLQESNNLIHLDCAFN